MSAPETLATVPLRDGEELRLQSSTRAGKTKLDVRLWTRTTKVSGLWAPTKHGFFIAADRVPDLVAALQAAKESTCS